MFKSLIMPYMMKCWNIFVKEFDLSLRTCSGLSKSIDLVHIVMFPCLKNGKKQTHWTHVMMLSFQDGDDLRIVLSRWIETYHLGGVSLHASESVKENVVPLGSTKRCGTF